MGSNLCTTMAHAYLEVQNDRIYKFQIAFTALLIWSKSPACRRWQLEQSWLNSQTQWSQSSVNFLKTISFQSDLPNIRIPSIFKSRSLFCIFSMCLFLIYGSMSLARPSFGKRIQATSASLHLWAQILNTALHISLEVPVDSIFHPLLIDLSWFGSNDTLL